MVVGSRILVEIREGRTGSGEEEAEEGEERIGRASLDL